MSSKFKPNSQKASYPPWCKPPPPPPPLPPPPPPGPYLSAYATWVDHDPAAFAHLSETVVLNEVTPGQSYSGESSATEPRLVVTADRLGDSDAWKVKIEIWDQWRQPEDWVWAAIGADPVDPMQVHCPTNVVHPLHDYRKVDLYG